MKKKLEDKINQLPQKSGVYLFKDFQGDIIYIGKANSLKNRVSSYFSRAYPHSAKVTKMINRIENVEYIITASEMEALLLESRLVKKYKPYFNTQLKDDKSYPYIQISIDHAFPGIFFIRKNRYNHKKKTCYYGPFIGADLARNAIKELRQIFKIRGCSDRQFEKGEACLDYQIGLCSAPCAGKIEKNDYKKHVEECCLLLSGQYKLLLRQLREKMNIASQFMFFEKAAKIRDSIQMIEKLINQGKISNSYRRKRDLYLKEKISNLSNEKALEDLKNYLKLSSVPKKIEAYDISNIHGYLAVGSMIVFQSGIPDKKKYRHYKIKEVKGINDYAMMRELISRRFRDSKTNNEYLPDLVLIDGGKGQLNSALDALRDLGIRLNIVSLAKREEELYLPEESNPVRLPRNTDVFFLIQRIRDEAHRFAINYHKKLRSKLIKDSVIDCIPGIGEKRKNILLSQFKSIDDIRMASIKDLKALAGFGEKTACKIKSFLEVRYDIEIQR